MNLTLLAALVALTTPSVHASPGTPATAASRPPATRTGTYVLLGSDAQTNPYAGDTRTSESLPLLCLRSAALADPHASAVTRTPGGALRRAWSGAEVALTKPLRGDSVTSRAAADDTCASELGDGWRMAEFHDGGDGAGWDFWARAASGDFDASRFWVAIDDQSASPWDGPSAMTWRLLDTSR